MSPGTLCWAEAQQLKWLASTSYICLMAVPSKYYCCFARFKKVPLGALSPQLFNCGVCNTDRCFLIIFSQMHTSRLRYSRSMYLVTVLLAPFPSAYLQLATVTSPAKFLVCFHTGLGFLTSLLLINCFAHDRSHFLILSTPLPFSCSMPLYRIWFDWIDVNFHFPIK